MGRMVGRLCASAVVAGFCLVGGQGLLAGQQKPIRAMDGWVKLPAAGETSAVAFASVENPGMYAIYLISATSDVAGKVEFRDASKGPKALEDVTVIAYETTYMDPKGIHMYLSDLKRPLKEGDTVTITLKTELGIPVEVSAVVKKE
jgi:periplasmic copper chaperone A